MARKFTWPSVAALEIGQSCGIGATVPEAKRKVGPYAARNNKRFNLEFVATEGPLGYCRVTREAVTDTELPGVG